MSENIIQRNYEKELNELESKHREEMYCKENKIKELEEKLHDLELKWSVVELFLGK